MTFLLSPLGQTNASLNGDNMNEKKLPPFNDEIWQDETRLSEPKTWRAWTARFIPILDEQRLPMVAITTISMYAMYVGATYTGALGIAGIVAIVWTNQRKRAYASDSKLATWETAPPGSMGSDEPRPNETSEGQT